MARSKEKTPSRRKKPSKIKTFIKSVFLLGLLMVAFGVIYAGSVIANAPEIDTSNIYAFMSESSTLYDDQGNVIDSVFTEGGNRVNLTYDEMPTDLINAVVAMEDKTFWDHHGFNIIRLGVAPGQELTAEFTGLPNQAGFNKSVNCSMNRSRPTLSGKFLKHHNGYWKSFTLLLICAAMASMEALACRLNTSFARLANIRCSSVNTSIVTVVLTIIVSASVSNVSLISFLVT